jgi:hypothetical protein
MILTLVQRVIFMVEQKGKTSLLLTNDLPSGKEEAVRVVSLRCIPAPE